MPFSGMTSYSSPFKAKVAFAAYKQESTISQFASHFKVHPQVVSKWKTQLLANIEEVFRDGRRKKRVDEIDIDGLYAKIGRFGMENDFLKNHNKIGKIKIYRNIKCNFVNNP
jgi:hypothetical protein